MIPLLTHISFRRTLPLNCVKNHKMRIFLFIFILKINKKVELHVYLWKHSLQVSAECIPKNGLGTIGFQSEKRYLYSIRMVHKCSHYFSDQKLSVQYCMCMGSCIFTMIPISIHQIFFFFCMYQRIHTVYMYLGKYSYSHIFILHHAGNCQHIHYFIDYTVSYWVAVYTWFLHALMMSSFPPRIVGLGPSNLLPTFDPY